MRKYTWLIFGGSIMLLAAFLGLILTPDRLTADTACDTLNCYTTDTTINELSLGKFYLTGLSNNGDGAVQLVPLGLTANWVPDSYTMPVSRTELSAVIYKDNIYVIGGQDPQGNRIAEVISAGTFVTGPLKGPWQTVTPLTPARSGTAAVIYTPDQNGGYLYVLGGSYKSGFSTVITDAVSYIHFNANGQFDGSWQTGAAMLDRMVYPQAVVHGNYLYVLGGCSGTDACNSLSSVIYRAQINPSNGALTWDNSFSALLPSSGLDLFGDAIWQSGAGTDYLYIVGGVTSVDFTSTTAEVWYASFNGSGGLNAWNQTGSLDQSYGAHATVQGNGQILTTGGLKGAGGGTVVTDVNSALIDITNGSLLPLAGSSSWIPSRVLPDARSRHASVINSGGVVYVIGGAGASGSDTAGGSNTIFRGETKGLGSLYAGKGTYVSHVLDLGSPKNITEINVNSTITSVVTMSVQYRYGNTLNELNQKAWTTFRGLSTGQNITTTGSANFSASLIQYQAIFTGTNVITSSLTPIFNAFQVRYPPDPTPTPTATTPTGGTPTPTRIPGIPDFAILGIQSPASTDAFSQTIKVRVANQGTGFNRQPIGRQSTTAVFGQQTTPRGGKRVLPSDLSRTPRGPNSYFVYVEMYVDPSVPPTQVTQLGNCPTIGGGTNWAWVYALGAGEYVDVPIDCYINAGTHQYYSQVDSCDNPGGSCNASYGYVQEGYETNNIFGPAPSGSTFQGGIFLPYIKKSP